MRLTKGILVCLCAVIGAGFAMLSAGAHVQAAEPAPEAWAMAGPSGSVSPDLSVTKTTTGTALLPGERVTFTIGYVNLGDASASGWITDIVPVTLTQQAVTWTGSLVPVPGLNYAWTYGPLGAGQGGVITVTGVTSPGLRGNLAFTNTVTSLTPGDVITSNDSSSARVNMSECLARVNDGVSDGAIRFQLQTAINEAWPGQWVKVAGYCVGNFSITKTLTVRGGYAGLNWATPDPATYPTTLDAALSGRVMDVTGGNVTLENLRLVNGRLSGADGTGLKVAASASVTVAASVISGNIGAAFGSDGAGIYAEGRLALSGTQVLSNAISGSSAGRGGGIYSVGGLILTNVSVLSNTNTSSSNKGGGLFVNGVASIANTTFSGNRADGFDHKGGAIFVESGATTLINVTLANNGVSTANLGGGIYRNSGAITLTNVLLSANDNGNCIGGVASTGFNLSSDASCAFGLSTDLNSTPALLGPLAFGHRRPLAGSLAIDSGTCALSEDALGGPRPAPGTPYCDIGAIEAPSVVVDLGVAVSAAPTQTVPARAITHTLIISNVGTGRASAFVITATLAGPYINVVSTTVLPGLAALTPTSASASQLVWSGSGLAQGSRITITLAGTTPYASPNGTGVTTTARISADGDANGANDQAAASTTLYTLPNLAVAKSVDAVTVLPGTRITFTIAYTNSGQAVANGTITDVVPVTLTQPLATWTGPLTPISGATYAWQLSGLAPATGGVITISGIVSNNIGGDASFTNTATSLVTGDIVPEDDASSARASVQGCYARAFDGISDGVIRNVMQQAVDDALPGQLVKLAGYCVGSTTVTKSLTIRGGYAFTNWVSADGLVFPATLDGVAAGRVMNVTGGTVSIENISLINGRVSGADGAGLSVSGGVTVTLLRSTVARNVAANFGADGGGISNNGTLVLSATQVSGNATSASSSGKGGGIINLGVLTLYNSSVLSNTNNNSSNKGGGLFSGGALTIVNTTFSGNRADGFEHRGGAIYLDAGSATLTNVTLANNGVSTANLGGGIYRNAGAMTLTNVLLSANDNGNCIGGVTSAGFNLSSDASCAFANATDLNDTPALLGPLTNGHRPPLAGSLAIDSGTCAVSSDAVGGPRPAPGSPYCDIGAIEAQFAAVDLSAVFLAAPTQTVPARVITYSVEISNTGSARASVFTVTLGLNPLYQSVVSATVLPPGVGLTLVNATPGQIVWTGANLVQGSRVIVTLGGATPLTTANGTMITLTAQVAAAGDGNSSNDMALAPTTVRTQPNLALVKSVDGATVTPGTRITFTIAYTNSGQAAAGGTITDIVPVTLTQATATWTGPLTPISGTPFVWALGTLAPATGGVITVTGVVSADVGSDASFTNTVTGRMAGDIVSDDDISSARASVQGCYARVFDGASDGPIRNALQVAIDEAAPGQLVKLSGICVGQMTVNKALTIRGGYSLADWVTANPAANLAAIDASKGGRVMNVTGGTVSIENISLINGRVSGADGAGLSVSAGVTVTLLRAKVANNVVSEFAADGGGIANGGTLVISATQVTGNATSASSGGKGGGIVNFGALALYNSSVLSNTNNDSSNKGGGLYSTGSVYAVNTTFAGNRADGFDHRGGAIAFDAGNAVLINVTIAGNGVSAFQAVGGGLYRGGGAVTLTNVLLSANAGGNCSGSLITAGFNLSSDASCPLTAATDLSGTIAFLDPLSNGHFGLTLASPAIDRGVCAVSTDALGQTRPGAGSGLCDIGAIEYQGAVRRAFVPTALR